MTDAARRLLLHEIGICTVFFLIEIGVDVHLAYVVEQIEIKVIHAALFELRFKDLLRLAHVGQIVPRKFTCEMKGRTRIG